MQHNALLKSVSAVGEGWDALEVPPDDRPQNSSPRFLRSQDEYLVAIFPGSPFGEYARQLAPRRLGEFQFLRVREYPDSGL